MTRALASVCLAGAVAALCACSDNNSVTGATGATAGAPNPSPGGCTQTMLASVTRSLGRDILDSTPFTTTEPGRVDITVNWRNANANVGAFVVQAGTCPQQTLTKDTTCSFLLQSGSDKPHRMSADLPAGSYELLLDDFGAGPGKGSSQTATAQIVLSTGDCPAR